MTRFSCQLVSVQPPELASLLLAGRSSAWLERLLWEQEAGGSNPPVPIHGLHRYALFMGCKDGSRGPFRSGGDGVTVFMALGDANRSRRLGRRALNERARRADPPSGGPTQ